MAFKTAAEMFGNGILIPTPGAFGPQVPFDTSNPPGTYTGNRGIQFGEQLTAAIANRTHYALALNDEDLNTRVAVFEANGLDAAYRGGALATPGSGRLIAKDGGAVETTSSLLTQYADDVSNAHFRADALGDTTSGGGFDFRGSAFANPAYGMLSRLNFSPAVTHTTMAAGEPIDLNPAAVGGDVIRFINPVHNGTLTDLALDGLDFIEISGAGVDNGLYRVFALGAATTDLVLRRLDGSAPSFPINGTGVATYFIANAATSSKVGITAGLAVSATAGENAVLAVMGRDTDGLLGTGPAEALAFYYQRDDGGSTSLAHFTSTGRLKSGITGGEVGSKAREIERAEGGLPIVNVNKSTGGGSGYHEVGVLVTDQDGVTSSYTGLETRGRLIESLTLGIGASVNGEYTAALGVIELTDSDGTPLPPPGPGVLHGQWTTLVQPGSTLVKILTGVGAGRYYLLSSVAVDVNPTNRDTMTLRRLDGTALSAGELPASGLLTFAFYARTTVGGRTAPIAVNSGPGFWTAPTDVTPNAVFHPATDVYGGADSDGVTAAMFAGNIIGARIDNTPTVAAGSHTLDVPWSMSRDGDLYTQGSLVSSASGSLAKVEIGNSSVFIGFPAGTYTQITGTAVAVTNPAGPFTAQVSATGLSVTKPGGFAAAVLSDLISVTNGGDTVTIDPASVIITDGTSTSTLDASSLTAQRGTFEVTAEVSGLGTLLQLSDSATGREITASVTAGLHSLKVADTTTPESVELFSDRVEVVGPAGTTTIYDDQVNSPDFEYSPTLDRYAVVSLADGQPEVVGGVAQWEYVYDPSIYLSYWETSAKDVSIRFPLRIPNQCSIIGVEVLVDQNYVPVVPSPTNSFRAALIFTAYDYVPAALVTPNNIRRGYEIADPSVITVGPLPPPPTYAGRQLLSLATAPNAAAAGFGATGFSSEAVSATASENQEWSVIVTSVSGVTAPGAGQNRIWGIRVRLLLGRPGHL